MRNIKLLYCIHEIGCYMLRRTSLMKISKKTSNDTNKVVVESGMKSGLTCKYWLWTEISW